MASYIDSTFVDAYLGTAVRTALVSDSGANLTTLIEGATAIVQTALRNSGYSVPTTTTDDTVKLAVMGALWVTLSSRPEYQIALPENWKEHPCRAAYVGILNGDCPVTLSLTSRDAVGGFSFSDASTSSSTGRVAYASRSAMKGW